MKTVRTFSSALSLLSVLFLVSLGPNSARSEPAPENSFYVVIGAFNLERNALKWMEYAGKSMEVDYAYNENRSLYYVWTFIANNKPEAVKLAKSLQQTKDYWDTWVFHGDLGKQLVATNIPVEEPKVEETIVTPDEPLVVVEPEVVDEPVVEEVVTESVVESVPEEDPEVAGYTYLRGDFKLASSDDVTAPITLVRLLVARGPLSEKQIGFAIFKLAIFSGALAVFSAFLMGVTF